MVRDRHPEPERKGLDNLYIDVMIDVYIRA